MKTAWLDQPGSLRWAALGYAAPVAVIIFLGVLQYRSLKRFVQKNSGTLMEFQFTENWIAVLHNGKRLELSWKEFKKVWVSKNILMLITCLNEIITLPITGLNAEQKSFVIEKLFSTNLLNSRQKYMLERPTPVEAPK